MKESKELKESKESQEIKGQETKDEKRQRDKGEKYVVCEPHFVFKQLIKKCICSNFRADDKIFVTGKTKSSIFFIGKINT